MTMKYFYLVQKLYPFGVYNCGSNKSLKAAVLNAESISIEEKNPECLVIVLEYCEIDSVRVSVRIIANFNSGDRVQ